MFKTEEESAEWAKIIVQSELVSQCPRFCDPRRSPETPKIAGYWGKNTGAIGTVPKSEIT